MVSSSTKDKIKSRLKFAAAASPWLAALFMYPKETFAFLAMLKEAGFEMGTLAVIGGIAWWLRKDVVRIVQGQLGELNTNVSNLSTELKSSNEESIRRTKISDDRYYEVNLRFLKNDEKFNDLGEKVVSIETRLQGLVPTIPPQELKDLVEKVSKESGHQSQP